MIIPKPYLAQTRKTHPHLSERMIVKDLALSYLLQELTKCSELVFKGGTFLTKCYLNYHRLSEDLDFSVPHLHGKSPYVIRRYVKETFLPLLQTIADKYAFEFNKEEFDTPETRYTPIKRSKQLFRFFVYLNEHEPNPIKIELSFIDPQTPTQARVTKQLLHTSKHLLYPLHQHKTTCLPLTYLIAEKIRALLTRPEGILERDIYDLYRLHHLSAVFSFTEEQKIVINRSPQKQLIKKRLQELQTYVLFTEIGELALTPINKSTYTAFFTQLKTILTQTPS